MKLNELLLDLNKPENIHDRFYDLQKLLTFLFLVQLRCTEYDLKTLSFPRQLRCTKVVLVLKKLFFSKPVVVLQWQGEKKLFSLLF